MAVCSRGEVEGVQVVKVTDGRGGENSLRFRYSGCESVEGIYILTIPLSYFIFMFVYLV